VGVEGSQKKVVRKNRDSVLEAEKTWRRFMKCSTWGRVRIGPSKSSVQWNRLSQIQHWCLHLLLQNESDGVEGLMGMNVGGSKWWRNLHGVEVSRLNEKAANPRRHSDMVP